jgi:hypothetical protein
MYFAMRCSTELPSSTSTPPPIMPWDHR